MIAGDADDGRKRERRIRARNRALLAVLLALVALFYVISDRAHERGLGSWPAEHRRSNGTTVVLLLSVVAGMVGLSFASVPLYSLFCQATGLGGTTQRAAAAPKRGRRRVRHGSLRCRDRARPRLGVPPADRSRSGCVPASSTRCFFARPTAGREPVTGTATYNVTPTKSGIYFDKLQCFCFTEQRLGPGESRDMGVQFFVDPDLVKDPVTRDVRHDHAVLHDVSQTRCRRPVAGAAGRRARDRATRTVN